MAKKDSSFTVSVEKEDVMYTGISKSKGGYNTARIVVKKGDNEYMSITYEWEHDGVPSFAMDLMGFMQANQFDVGKVVSGMEESYAKYVDKTNS